MTTFEIDGNKFHVGDEDLAIDFEIDAQSGLVELSATDKNGNSSEIYLKRDIALSLTLWLKSRLSH